MPITNDPLAADRLEKAADAAFKAHIRATTGNFKLKPETTLLADKFLESSYRLPKIMSVSGKMRAEVTNAMQTYRIALRQANRFILEDDFVELSTEVSARSAIDGGPKKILDRLQSSILPYRSTWIEFDPRVKVAQSIKMGLTTLKTVDPGVPPVTGLLLQRDINRETAWVMTVFSPGLFGNPDIVSPHPAVYMFDSAGLTQLGGEGVLANHHFIRYSDKNFTDDENFRLLIRKYELAPWGFQMAEDSQLITSGLVQALLDHSRLTMALPYQKMILKDPTHHTANFHQGVGKAFATDVIENSGLLRWVVTVLAMLAEVPVISSHQIRPQGSRMVGSLNRSYMDYHRISIKLPKKNAARVIERKLDRAASRRHRRHEVRSHWRTYVNSKYPHCEHDWEYDHDNRYRLCGKCMAHGRKLLEYERGDASLGWVKHDYVLEANRAS